MTGEPPPIVRKKMRAAFSEKEGSLGKRIARLLSILQVPAPANA
jgi:hypothetical protein